MGTHDEKAYRRLHLNLLIDTDCGVDDAGAILMALSARNISVRGISTVSGNVALNLVTDNVLRLLSFFGRDDIPVYPGAFRPLIEPRRDASGVHGSNGLGDVLLPETRSKAEDLRAPEGIYGAAKSGGPCTLVALGPLTNLACTIVLYPDLGEYVEHLVIMGGAIDRGNVTRHAEFNIAADPEAAEIVFNAGIPITLLPWDVCLSNIFPETELLQLGLEKSKAGRLFLEMNAAPLGYFETMTGKRSLAMADELAMACLLRPDMVTGSLRSDIHVELGRNALRGATVTAAGGSVKIVTDIDRSTFISTLTGISALF